MKLSADIRRSTTHYARHKYPFTFFTADYVEAKSRRASLQNYLPHVTVDTRQLSCLMPTFQPTASIDDWVTVLYAAAVVVRLVLFSEFTFAICRRSSVCLSSVTFVHPTQVIEIFRSVFTPFGMLDIYWLQGKILRRSSQGNPSVGGVKPKRGSQI